MLKLVVAQESEIPEGFSEAYESRDGAFHLKLDDAVVPKAKLDEFRENNIQLMQQKKDLETQMETFKDVDPVKYKEYKKKLQELDDKKMIDENDIEGLLSKRVERMKADFDGQTVAQTQTIDTLKTTNSSLSEQLSTVLIDSSIQQAVTEIGAVRPGAMEDILARGRRTFKLVDGKPTPIGPDGKTPIYGKDGKEIMTFTEWSRSLLETAPFLFEKSTGGGSQGGGGNHNKNRGAKTIMGGDPQVFGDNLEDIASGKTKVKM